MDYPAAPHAAVDDDTYGGFHIPKGDFLTVSLSDRMSIDIRLQVLSS